MWLSCDVSLLGLSDNTQDVWSLNFRSTMIKFLMDVLNIARDTLILKHFIHLISIRVHVLDFYLLNLATLPGALPWATQ